MYSRLDPKSLTVFITGATSGFGLATARRFAAEGSKVIATGRRRERLEMLRGELGDNCHIAEMDVRRHHEIDAVLDALPEPFAQINTVIANAGLALGVGPAQDASIEDWDVMVDTNIKGLMYTLRLLLPRLIESKEGHVVTMGSVAGDFPYPGGNVYGATKAFVKQLALAARADLQGCNVRMTNIEPGLAETEFTEVRLKGNSEAAKKIYQNTHFLTSDDVAEAIFWAVNLPRHVNVNRLSLMPVTQAFSPLDIHRET